MTHQNRNRVTVSTNPADIDAMLMQRKFNGDINLKIVGTVTRGTGETGLLVQSTITNQYWLWDGAYSSLDERKVNAAMGKVVSKKHGMMGQQNAKKENPADAMLRVRVRTDDKSAWIVASKKKGGLSAWVIETLNKAAKEDALKNPPP
ncbi:hypothetical protein DTO96_102527 [Ephemeroptericola cinctiostellae]|uniref:Uncharacterized protein n=1 Tax=Ephemeroptericola cinctiostellae TaxID=2268024 RepID=A0A345DEI3_9BURK|nr:hypothetical protein [Ephemeroptericola cinctiostellae]AXF86771.1 hypothetical protein DTO96_102527 [Ephemeroptericola cinctiostellae]